MTRAVPSILTILLLNSLATLQAADAKGFTLVERHGRTGLLTPKGKPFIMLGISQLADLPPFSLFAPVQLNCYG